MPYITKDTICLIRKKLSLFKRAKHLNSGNAWAAYNKVRNQVTSALRSAKKNFITKLSDNIHSPKDFWSTYYKLSPTRSCFPDTLSHQSVKVQRPLEKANLFNQFFSSCFSRPSSFSSSPSLTSKFLDCSLSSITCSVDEVSKLLSTYKTNTASGPDGISSIMVRNTADSISPALTSLFNLSLETSKVTSQWKLSNVTPILKSGDPSLINNYRPISLLSLVSKVLERIVHQRVSNYLQTHHLLSRRQFGFRAGSSTQEALLSITNDWHLCLSSNHQVGAVFFDIKKAFDTVPHEQILLSLERIGISGSLLSWFSNYLSGRTQRVVINGTTSDTCEVTSGVPQGSILGPLLFTIFMDSVCNLPLSHNSKLALYADDIVLYKPINSPCETLAFQQDVDEILLWTTNHGLTLNTSKTYALPITRSPKPISLNLHIDGNPIADVLSVKYLGVTVTADLNWSRHVHNISSKAKQQIGLIYRRLYQATPLAHQKIYRSVVLPKLEYCAAVWDPHQSILIDELEKVQGFAGKVVTKDWKASYNTNLNKCNWQLLSTRRKLQKLKICYNILNNFSIIPHNVFTPHPSPSPRYPHNRIISRPLTKTNTHQFSFFVDVIPYWNSLPSHVVNSTSSNSFKAHLSEHLLTNIL